MELRQLRYFIAVAEELHFGRAAERLQMTRPPLSQQIQALEREIGVELFARGQHIALTDAGRAFLEHARRITEVADHAARAAREAGEGTTRLRLGYPATVASRYASTAVRLFRERYPAIALETVVAHTGAHLMALSARQLDIAFVHSGTRRTWTGRFRPLYPERFLVAVHEDHPFAKLPAIRAEQLAGEPVVLFPRALDPPLHDHLMLDVFERAGVSLSVALEATTLESSLGAVAAGLGVAFTAQSGADLVAAQGVAFRPLVTTAPDLEVGVAWRPEPSSRAVQQFLAVIDELAGNAGRTRQNGTIDRPNGHLPGTTPPATS
jgi:DNA-binding transcriptional LysR family regulator